MKAKRIVCDDESFRIVRTGSRGKDKPASYRINAVADVGDPRTFEDRSIVLTIDELFDLTERLDDICDEIEDKEIEMGRLPPR